MTSEETIREFLAGETTLVLSTVSGERVAQSAPLFYLLDEHEIVLYWLSSASSRHSVNAMECPECAVSVFHATGRWEEIVGVQMAGIVDVAADGRRDRILKLYVERFRLGGLHEDAVSRSTMFRFRPSWIRYIDNSKGFGYKFEMTLDPRATE